MATRSILDDFYDHSYTLIAIHCAAEDYRLAYFLNVQLHTRFKRLPDIVWHQNHIAFSLYEWEDHKNSRVWNLISNTAKGKNMKTNNNNTLFNKNIPAKMSYLIPERKQTDYFLKINDETMQEDITILLYKINTIPQIITTYSVDPDELKSKHNLII